MRSTRFTTLASILALLAACGGGGSDSGGSAPPFTVLPTPDPDTHTTPDHRRLFAARAAGLGRGAIARMVPVSRTVAGHARSFGLCDGQCLYRCADRHRAGAVQGSLLHLSDLDRRGECILQLGVERWLRHPLVVRFGGRPVVRRRSLRGRPGARRRDRSRHRNTGDRHQRDDDAHGGVDLRRRGRGRGQRGARAVGRGRGAGAALHQRRGRARGQRDQGGLRHFAGLVALRRQDLRG